MTYCVAMGKLISFVCLDEFACRVGWVTEIAHKAHQADKFNTADQTHIEGFSPFLNILQETVSRDGFYFS
jgi:hypothetical protein